VCLGTIEKRKDWSSWAHSEDQPLTIYFVGGFFFGASLVPGFERNSEDYTLA